MLFPGDNGNTTQAGNHPFLAFLYSMRTITVQTPHNSTSINQPTTHFTETLLCGTPDFQP